MTTTRLALAAILAALLACKEKTPEAPPAPRVHSAEAAKPSAIPPPTQQPAAKPQQGPQQPTISQGLSTPPPLDPARLKEEQCVDGWLKAKKLNQYGDPPDTVYAGGNPLFDEASGRTTDRLERVFQKHPEARTQCAPPAK